MDAPVTRADHRQPDYGLSAIEGRGRSLAAALHREGWTPASVAESAEAACGLSESRVLQETEDAPVHRADASGDHVR